MRGNDGGWTGFPHRIKTVRCKHLTYNRAGMGAALVPRATMKSATQFCIGLDDRPGALARLCTILREADINIEAIFVGDDPEGCWVNLLPSDENAANNALAEHGYSFSTEPVLLLDLPHKAGELEHIAKTLADAGVNIDYVYGSGSAGAPFRLVLAAGDIAAARRALTAG